MDEIEKYRFLYAPNKGKLETENEPLQTRISNLEVVVRQQDQTIQKIRQQVTQMANQMYEANLIKFKMPRVDIKNLHISGDSLNISTEDDGTEDSNDEDSISPNTLRMEEQVASSRESTRQKQRQKQDRAKVSSSLEKKTVSKKSGTKSNNKTDRYSLGREVGDHEVLETDDEEPAIKYIKDTPLTGEDESSTSGDEGGFLSERRKIRKTKRGKSVNKDFVPAKKKKKVNDNNHVSEDKTSEGDGTEQIEKIMLTSEHRDDITLEEDDAELFNITQAVTVNIYSLDQDMEQDILTNTDKVDDLDQYSVTEKPGTEDMTNYIVDYLLNEVIEEKNNDLVKMPVSVTEFPTDDDSNGNTTSDVLATTDTVKSPLSPKPSLGDHNEDNDKTTYKAKKNKLVEKLKLKKLKATKPSSKHHEKQSSSLSHHAQKERTVLKSKLSSRPSTSREKLSRMKPDEKKDKKKSSFDLSSILFPSLPKKMKIPKHPKTTSSGSFDNVSERCPIASNSTKDKAISLSHSEKDKSSRKQREESDRPKTSQKNTVSSNRNDADENGNLHAKKKVCPICWYDEPCGCNKTERDLSYDPGYDVGFD